MGMSASQARLLELTARCSNLEYEAQQISEARIMLSKYVQNATTEYNNAMQNRCLFYNPQDEVFNDDSAKPYILTYSDIVSPYEEGGMGYRLTDAQGRIIVPYIPSDVPESEHYKYVVDLDVLDSAYLENGLRNNGWIMQKPTKNNSEGWENTDWRSNPFISDELDKSDDDEATAIYEAKIAQYQQQDKELELRLKNIETEHNAVKTEIEAVDKVLEENIKKSFDSFG